MVAHTNLGARWNRLGELSRVHERWSRAKRMIARVAASVIVWLALVLGLYIIGSNLKLALGGLR